MNKYELKKILEDHSLYYGNLFVHHMDVCKHHDYVVGWLDAVDSIATKTNIKLYSGVINDLLCRFSNIRNPSEILKKLQETINTPMYITDKEAYLKGYNDVCDYIFLRINEKKSK